MEAYIQKKQILSYRPFSRKLTIGIKLIHDKWGFFLLKLQFPLVAKLKAHGYIPTDAEHAMWNAFKFSNRNKSTMCKYKFMAPWRVVEHHIPFSSPSPITFSSSSDFMFPQRSLQVLPPSNKKSDLQLFPAHFFDLMLQLLSVLDKWFLHLNMDLNI